MLKRSAWAAAMAAGFLLVHPGGPASALQDCASDCADLSVGSNANIPANSGGSVTVSFRQGPDDGQAGEGNDDIAAIAFSIGIPGDGSGNPLVLKCDGGQLASNAVSVGGAISSGFQVVVENESCNSRERCLCPTGQQQRDDFINLVIYGPKDLPEGGPVEIPRLPDGNLLTLNMQAGDGVQPGDTVDLHLFCEQDNGSPARPEFTADVSIGDQAAIDQTADRDADRSRITCGSGKITFVDAVSGCDGDCNMDGMVAINELIQGVNISLGNLDVSVCTAMDGNGDGSVAINELIKAVNNALNGCPT